VRVPTLSFRVWVEECRTKAKCGCQVERRAYRKQERLEEVERARQTDRQIHAHIQRERGPCRETDRQREREAVAERKNLEEFTTGKSRSTSPHKRILTPGRAAHDLDALETSQPLATCPDQPERWSPFELETHQKGTAPELVRWACKNIHWQPRVPLPQSVICG
jgi:hypothetical protein